MTHPVYGDLQDQASEEATTSATATKRGQQTLEGQYPNRAGKSIDQIRVARQEGKEAAT